MAAEGRGFFLDVRVKKAQQIMRSNLHRKLPLDEIASSVEVSVWWFCHIFRSETGMSPIQYLKTLRIERARYLLQTSTLSFRDITRGVGLQDDSHFARDFKKIYGKPPIDYRMRLTRSHLRRSTDSFRRQQIPLTNSKIGQRK